MNNVYQYHNHCCGCGLCSEICPNNAIQLVENESGFVFPQIDTEKCNECGLCLSYCSFNQNNNNQNLCSSQFLVQHKDDLIRQNSRSGGAFTALTDEIINRGGVVYGCMLTSSFQAKHGRAHEKQIRDTFLGSKYTQSEIKETFKRIKDDLLNDNWVLFSGTPCQVDAVKTYCKSIKTKKLILVDIVCFGIPGRKLWRDYLDNIESVYNCKVKDVNFRNKKDYGWSSHIETIELENGKHFSGEIYARLFGEKLIIRDSCFRCPYKSLHRVGDITLADAWGIDDTYSDFNDDKGTSLVLINTEKGTAFFNRIKQQIRIIKLESLDAFLQPCLKDNWPMPKEYYDFWNDYGKMSFEKLTQKYINMSVKSIVNSQKKKESFFNKLIRKLSFSD